MSDGGKFKPGDRVRVTRDTTAVSEGTVGRWLRPSLSVPGASLLDLGERGRGWIVPDDALELLPAAPDPRREQVGGDHYTRLEIQPWDVIEATFGPEGIYAYFAGNVVKYLMRAHSKGGLEDLRKARHYLGRLEALVEQGKAACGKVTQPEDEQ